MSVDDYIVDELKVEIISALKQSIGLNDVIANNLAGILIIRLRKKWGSRRIYFPVPDKENRDDLIRFDFNGANHADVCKKYNISLRTLYRVTK